MTSISRSTSFRKSGSLAGWRTNSPSNTRPRGFIALRQLLRSVKRVKRKYNSSHRRTLAEQTRAQIQQGARTLSGQQGYANTTVAQIAKEAGVSEQPSTRRSAVRASGTGLPCSSTAAPQVSPLTLGVTDEPHAHHRGSPRPAGAHRAWVIPFNRSCKGPSCLRRPSRVPRSCART